MSAPQDGATARMGRRGGAGLLSVALLLVVSLAGLRTCGASTPEVVDFGLPGSTASPAGAARGDLDLSSADPAAAPAPGAVLDPGGYPAVSGFVAREAAAGRPTVVNLFASWCPPCVREMPLVVEAAELEPGIAFLGVAHLDREEDARRFVDEQDVSFTTVLDLDGDTAFAVGGRGMPTTVAFDREGRLVARVIGELTPASLEELLAAVR
ncbi:MAG: Thiol-disulfide oxidoreductase resA [Actinomycetota bacterium]